MFLLIPIQLLRKANKMTNNEIKELKEYVKECGDVSLLPGLLSSIADRKPPTIKTYPITYDHRQSLANHIFYKGVKNG